MNLPSRSNLTHLLFIAGVYAKAVDGIFEIIGGVALFFAHPGQINSIVQFLTQPEISEDPHDLIAGFLRHSAGHLTSGAMTFAALLLLVHGVIKVGLVAGLLKRKLWAYPTAMIGFGLFTVYQIYRYAFTTHSNWLLVITVLDVYVVVLTWLEYRHVRAASTKLEGPE